MLSKVYYAVYEPTAPNGLELIELSALMERGDCREIIKPGSKEEVELFMSQYTAENKFTPTAVVQQTQIIEARKKAGKDLGETVPREYPLITNNALTDNEKMDILNKAFEDAGFLLHAALVYTGETRTIDANVTTKTGEKYLLTFQKKSNVSA